MANGSASNGKNHAFISYVHEDSEQVDRLQRNLEAAGVTVWRDKDDLWPGEDWRIKIRKAIADESLAFIACFSENSQAKDSSYQNEELFLAVDQMRLRPPGRVWLLPVRLSDCELPDFDLGANRNLDSIQRVDLFGDKRDEGISRLVSAVVRLIGNSGDREMASYSPPLGTQIKSMLLASDKQIDLEDLISEKSKSVRRKVLDKSAFSKERPELDDPSITRFLVDRCDAYSSAVDPLIDLLVPGCIWGRKEHEQIWSRVISDLANADKDGTGNAALINLAKFPALIAIYAGGLAAIHRKNYSAFRAVVSDPIARTNKGPRPVLHAVHPWAVFENLPITASVLAFREAGEAITDETIESLRKGTKGKRKTPISDYLRDHLRDRFSDLIFDDDEYTEAFDRFEALSGLVELDAKFEHNKKGVYVHEPYVGAFHWRYPYGGHLEVQILQEIESQGQAWEPLKAMLFGGSLERAIDAANGYVEIVRSYRRYG